MADPLETANFTLGRDRWGRLVLVDAHGVRHVGVEPVRAFPITDAGHCISILNAEGEELISVPDLAKVPEPQRALLVEELERREFMPVIERILQVSSQSDPTEWHVVTNRGPVTSVGNSEDDIRRLDETRAIVVDAYGTQYLIADSRNLDSASRRILERYL